jgi:hypothetical protein
MSSLAEVISQTRSAAWRLRSIDRHEEERSASLPDLDGNDATLKRSAMAALHFTKR